MLQKIRDRSGGVVAFIIFGLLILAFAVWGIDFNFAAQNYVAKVNGENIPVEQIRRVYQRQIAQFTQYYPDGQIPEEMQAQIRNNVLNGMVRNEVLVQHALGEGFRVGDQALMETVREIQLFHQDGRFDLDTYRAQLARQGYTEALFEQETRRALAVAQLQDTLRNSAFVTRSERERRAAIENESRDVAYLTFPVVSYLDKVELTEEDIQADYEANLDRYRTPETVDLEYVEVLQADVAGQVEESRVRERYEADAADGLFAKPEQRKARHILIRADSDTSDDEARAEAAELLSRIRAGEDFARLARESSDDPGSAADGGSLEWSVKESFAEEFGDALFSMAVGDISEPVETSFGYHIIELEDIRDGGNDSFEEVADRLRVELAADAFFAASNEVDEQAFNNADSLQAAADSRGLEIKTLDGVGRLGGQGIAANQAVVAAAFSDEVLLDGLNSRAIEIADDHVVFLRVKNHNESQQRPLEEVRNIVQASLQAARAQELAEAKAEEALAQFESGTPFGALESAEEAIFNEAITARRTASGNLPAVVVQTAFSLAEPEGDAPALAITNLQGGDAAVVAVSNVSPGTISDDAARNAQLAQAEGVSDFQAYVNSLMEDASVSIRPDLLQ